MKYNKVKIGQQVVVNDLPDATVYTIESMESKFVAKLSYITEAGHKVSGGYMDVSILKEVK